MGSSDQVIFRPVCPTLDQPPFRGGGKVVKPSGVKKTTPVENRGKPRWETVENQVGTHDRPGGANVENRAPKS